MIGSKTVGVIGLIKLVGLELNKKLIESNVPLLSLLKYKFNSLENSLDMNINAHLKSHLDNYFKLSIKPTENINNDKKIFIKDFVPLNIQNINSIETIVFSHPSVESLANNYISSNPNSRKGTIIWDKFPDSQPNIKFESNLEDKKIIFFMSVYDTSILFEQL
jgi:hypothetical protein